MAHSTRAASGESVQQGKDVVAQSQQGDLVPAVRVEGHGRDSQSLSLLLFAPGKSDLGRSDLPIRSRMPLLLVRP